VVDRANFVIVKESIMSAKELVLKTVRKMSDELSMEEILEELSILAAIREGENAADAGKVISHEEMKKRAKSWNTK
jgi:predicted transcriptional regulator